MSALKSQEWLDLLFAGEFTLLGMASTSRASSIVLSRKGIERALLSCTAGEGQEQFCFHDPRASSSACSRWQRVRAEKGVSPLPIHLFIHTHTLWACSLHPSRQDQLYCAALVRCRAPSTECPSCCGPGQLSCYHGFWTRSPSAAGSEGRGRRRVSLPWPCHHIGDKW